MVSQLIIETCPGCPRRSIREALRIEVRVLGELEVAAADLLVPIGGAKQRAVLGLLVAAHGRSMRADQIFEALYSEASARPRTQRVIHTYVSNLRRVLGDAIVATTRGYSMDSLRSSSDADRFTALVEAARNLRGEAPNRSVRLLESALALWRGDPYAGLEDVELLRPEIVRLGEQLIDATALLNEIRLELGRCHEAIPELSAIVAAHPYRENLVALLMWALHQSGATGQARRVYVDTARLLRDELGARPSRLLDEALDRLDVDSVVPGPIALGP